MQLVASTVTGTIGKQLFRLGLQALKGLGWLGGPFGEGAIIAMAASIAASVTYGFGWACNAYYKSGMQINLGEIGHIYKKMYSTYMMKSKKEGKLQDIPIS